MRQQYVIAPTAERSSLPPPTSPSSPPNAPFTECGGRSRVRLLYPHVQRPELRAAVWPRLQAAERAWAATGGNGGHSVGPGGCQGRVPTCGDYCAVASSAGRFTPRRVAASWVDKGSR
jgi:hypothetical protein